MSGIFEGAQANKLVFFLSKAIHSSSDSDKGVPSFTNRKTTFHDNDFTSDIIKMRYNPRTRRVLFILKRKTTYFLGF